MISSAHCTCTFPFCERLCLPDSCRCVNVYRACMLGKQQLPCQGHQHEHDWREFRKEETLPTSSHFTILNYLKLRCQEFIARYAGTAQQLFLDQGSAQVWRVRDAKWRSELKRIKYENIQKLFWKHFVSLCRAPHWQWVCIMHLSQRQQTKVREAKLSPEHKPEISP